ncbi:DUF4258 domain-containing protein [Lysinibacillus xylanilyticus]|uniref:DUF4258 domain-containing protein n=1 Tax=Lysinibacillus xylanilyticus TaxID=582475 RepID=UPI0038005E1F
MKREIVNSLATNFGNAGVSKVERDLRVEQYLKLRQNGINIEGNRVDFLTEKDIRKAFLNNSLILSAHAQEKMLFRGYNKRDLISLIWTGERTELQYQRNSFKAVIEGFDSSNNPICMVVGSSSLDNFIKQKNLKIITVFPPIKEKFLRRISEYNYKRVSNI